MKPNFQLIRFNKAYTGNLFKSVEWEIINYIEEEVGFSVRWKINSTVHAIKRKIKRKVHDT